MNSNVQERSSISGSLDSISMPVQSASSSIQRRDGQIKRFWLFWAAVVAGVLLIGVSGASQTNRGLWHGAGGWLLLALCLVFWCWYMSFPRLRGKRGWPPPRYLTYPWLLGGLVLAAVLLAYGPSFTGVPFVVIGMSVSVLSTKESYVPVGAAVLLYLHTYNVTLFPLSPSNLSNLGSALFYVGMGAGISYSMAALFRQRHERDHLIEELQEAQRHLRAAAVRDAELAALRERNRLAREMHDSLGHALVLIAVKIEAAQRLQAVDPERAAAEWEDTKALVRSAMTDLRNSLAGLRLPVLEEQPLPQALAGLAGEMGRRTGVEVSSDVDSNAVTLPREVQEALYRVGQEGLANVARHARARHAGLSLRLGQGAALLEVSDDGIGLGATPRNVGGHYGVLGMRERVEALGGTLTLGPRPEGGTVLRASVPLRDAIGDRR